MKSNSRTYNSIKNIGIGSISQIFTTLLKFITQTVFIKILGSSYLGINGLFTNILTVLSFAELGIGNAIIYSMYTPIAHNDINKIKSLMNLYKKSYNVIAIVIFTLGLLVMPFLDKIVIGAVAIKENIKIIYLLFLLNTSVSYFAMYKKSIISAHQKEYILNIISFIFYIINQIGQIIILVYTQNYILFLIVGIACTIGENIYATFIANKMFPYLKDKNVIILTSNEKKDIFSNVSSLVVYKFGSVVMNGTDNIIISAMINISTVGIVSNYNLLINAITVIIEKALNGFTASIGNLNATENSEKRENIFNQLFFISTWIYGFFSVALICLIEDFINIWIGKTYVLDFLTTIIIIVNFYINGIRFAGYSYRITNGLFTKGKSIPLIAAIINIFLSILLGKKYGIMGIILATIISRLLTVSWNDPYLIYKYVFKKSNKKYWFNFILFSLIVLINGFFTFLLVRKIIVKGIFEFIIKGILTTLISNLLFVCFFFQVKEFKQIINKLNNLKKI